MHTRGRQIKRKDGTWKKNLSFMIIFRSVTHDVATQLNSQLTDKLKKVQVRQLMGMKRLLMIADDNDNENGRW